METHKKVYDKYLTRARDLCSRQEKCVSGMIQKLEAWDCPPSLIPSLIEALVTAKYIDEQRFATGFTHTKFRQNNWGKNKISYALKNKNIPEETIQKTLELEISTPEYEKVLRQLLRNKLIRIGQGTTYEKLGKLINFATAKGYEYALVKEIASQLVKK